MRWYRANEIHRFDQPIGKQYSYGLGPDFKSDSEKKDHQMAHLKMENEILKKYMELVKELKKELKRNSSSNCGEVPKKIYSYGDIICLGSASLQLLPVAIRGYYNRSYS